MNKYLYRKLRDYLNLYVRPDDRIVEIDAKKIAHSLKFQSPNLMVVQRVRPDGVLLKWRHPL